MSNDFDERNLDVIDVSDSVADRLGVLRRVAVLATSGHTAADRSRRRVVRLARRYGWELVMYDLDRSPGLRAPTTGLVTARELPAGGLDHLRRAIWDAESVGVTTVAWVPPAPTLVPMADLLVAVDVDAAVVPSDSADGPSLATRIARIVERFPSERRPQILVDDGVCLRRHEFRHGLRLEQRTPRASRRSHRPNHSPSIDQHHQQEETS